MSELDKLRNNVFNNLQYIEKLEQENKQLKVKSEVLEENNKLLIQQKAQMIAKYIDELLENEILTNQWYKSTQKIKKAIEYLEQPNRDNFDFSKAQLLEILGDKE